MDFGNNPTVNYDMNSPALFPPRSEQPFMPPVKSKPLDILTNGPQKPLDQLTNDVNRQDVARQRKANKSVFPGEAISGSKKFGSYIGQ